MGNENAAKKLIILGSTGSIGKQTLDIVSRNREKFTVTALSCGKDIDALERQARAFGVKKVAVADESKAAELSRRAPYLEVYGGKGCNESLASEDGDTVVAAMVGISGLTPTVKAIESGKTIALANKETLVAGGDIVMPLARRHNAEIIPVDSEHSAIWQSMHFSPRPRSVKKLILTASGGPFRTLDKENFGSVKAADALRHPTWNMGAKVTIDSATMMNKGLEIIEAMHLFGVKARDIEVVVHRESIVHSMVEYDDNSVIAEMSYPTMEIPIALALTYPDRVESDVAPIDWGKLGALHFEYPDTEKFECLAIAKRAAEEGGFAPVIMNAANETLVPLFLADRIKFTDIPYYIQKTLDAYRAEARLTLENILECDIEVRAFVNNMLRGV